MLCPYCAHDFPLTWRRYWTSPFGKHTCPACARLSRLRTGWPYWLLYVPIAAASPLVAVALTALAYATLAPGELRAGVEAFVMSGWAYAPIGVALALFAPLDRMIDARFRRLRPIGRG